MANWNFEDFLQRIEAIKHLGSLDELVKQLPDLGAILEDAEFSFEDLAPIESILRAMTLEERLNPELLDGDQGRERRERVAERAETSVESVDSLIWQFGMLRKMLETMSPDAVTRELMESMQPERDEWQVPPNHWKKTKARPDAPFVGQEEAAEEEAAEPEPAPEPTFQERVDAILRKISEEGMEALTPEERDYLQGASRRYRVRRGEVV